MARNVGSDASLQDLPYSVSRQICLSMDVDRSWEDLASALGYSFEQTQALQLQHGRHDGSPTRALLWEWGCRGATIRDLYNQLSQLQRRREMEILDKYLG